VDLKGVVPTRPIHTVAYLGLARAQALAGNFNASRKAYEEFFGTLRDSDEGIPEIEKARSEYAALLEKRGQ
jgi:hypothetical protein